MHYQHTQGIITPIDGFMEPIYFQWNPAAVNIHKSSKWHPAAVAGRSQPVFQFGCGGSVDVSFSLEVSRWNNSDFFVKGYCDSILLLTEVVPGLSRPPLVDLTLGDSLSLIGFIADVAVHYQSTSGGKGYDADPNTLLPKEALVNIQFTEYRLFD